MNNLKEYNGHFYESDYEYALISFLESEGWDYSNGNNLSRITKKDVLDESDLNKYLSNIYVDLTKNDILNLINIIKLIGSESDFATLHKFYKWIVDGYLFTTESGEEKIINLIDFEKTSNNIFKVVNQLTVEYTNSGKMKIENQIYYYMLMDYLYVLWN